MDRNVPNRRRARAIAIIARLDQQRAAFVAKAMLLAASVIGLIEAIAAVNRVLAAH